MLPFANLSGDPEQEYFVDGVTESLTADLSRITGSFVIGRHTAFTYKGKAVDLKQIGHELKVRYVLEGSVQRGGNRLRVNVQLIDTETVLTSPSPTSSKCSRFSSHILRSRAEVRGKIILHQMRTSVRPRLLSEQAGEALDALRDQLGMLDHVGGMGEMEGEAVALTAELCQL